MLRTRQFSLSYLLTETALAAIGLGLLRQSILFTQSDAYSIYTLRILAVPASFGFLGAAIGGLFGRLGMGIGVVIGIALFLALLLVVPAVR
jgi:hypothetical protein